MIIDNEFASNNDLATGEVKNKTLKKNT